MKYFLSFLFFLTINSIYAQVPTNQDCLGAIPVCQNVFTQNTAYSGTGNYPTEINSGPSCLGSGEKNDVWYTFTTQTAGNVCFSITPNTSSDDYDWAVYNLSSNNCSDIFNNAGIEVSCNYSGSSGVTGPNGNSGTQNEPCIAVNAGETYVVNVSQFSTSTAGYTLDFGASTATIFDNVAPVINNIVLPIACGATTLTFDFSENVLCSSASINDFQLTGPGGPYTLTNLTGTNCAAGGSQEDQFTVTVSPAITVSGAFQICLVGGAGFVEDLCGNLASAGCWNFNISNNIVADAGIDVTTCLDAAGNTVPVTLGGTPTGSGGSGYTYSWSPTTNLSNANIANPIASPSTNTTYTVTVNSSNGCAATDAVNVSISNLNTPTMATVPETCLGANDGSATATPTNGTPGYSYTWTPSGQTTQTATGLTPGNYSVTVTDVNGCGATNNITVVAGPPIVAGFTPPINQCLTGNSYTFTNTGTTGGGTTFSWDFGDGSGTSTQENPSYTYTAAGTFTVTQTVTSGACSDVATVNVTVYPMPTPAGTTTPVLCNGGSTGTATVGAPGYASYQWDAAAGNQTTNPASNLAAGSYTVTVTDANGCSAPVTLVVTEPVVLTATATNVAPSCAAGADGTATANGVDGTGSYTYSWNTSPAQATQTATGLTAGTYTATVTDASGCTTTVNTTLTDPPGMVLSSSMTQANCGQPDGSATVAVTSGGSGNFSYSWNTTPVQNTAIAANIAAGTYIATVNDITNGCVAFDTIIVTSTTGITATATLINDALCNGSADGQAYATPTGGTGPYTYSWNTTPAQTTDTVTAGAGTYTVVITDNNGCTGNDAVTIAEPILLVTTIPTSTDASCFGAADGTATGSNTGGTAPFTYSWNTTPAQTTLTATGLAAGNYELTVTDGNNCFSTASITILDGPQLTSSVTGTPASCFGGNDGTADFTPNGGVAPFTYNWSSGSTAEDPTGLSAGTHYVTATSANGCVVMDSVLITEPTQLVAVIDSVKDATCNGFFDGTTYASASGGTTSYTYAWNDPAAQTTASATGLGFGSFTVTVTDANGCITTVNTNVAQPAPVAATTGSFDAYCGVDQGTVWVDPTTGVAPFTFAWDSSLVAIGNTDTITNLFPGTYNLLAADANGCKFTTSVTVIAAPGGTAAISNVTDVSCFGGSDGTATVSTGGAFPGFTYLWDAAAGNQTTNLATGLSAGSYNVIVTDTFGCVMNTTANINQPVIALSVSMFASDKICPDSCNASADGNPSGGTAPYTFVWNDPSAQITQSAGNLCSGTYTVLVTDANGCTITDSVIVNNPPKMVIGNTTVPANCNQSDGSASASVTTNGTAPFTFQWTDGTSVISNSASINNVPAGTYFVTAFDSLGCSVIDTVTIPNLSGPSIAIDSIFDVLCFGGTNGYAEVQVTGGVFPYTYLWNDPMAQTTPSGSNLTAGNYTVTATDSNGCVVSTAITINEPPVISLTAGGTDPSCFGFNDGSTWVNANGGVMPYTYLWNDPAAQTNDTTNTLSAGTYIATVVDSNNCFDTISVVLVDPLLFSVNVTGNNVQCFNACDGNAIANLTNGIAPFTYAWDDPAAQSTDSIFGLCDTTVNVAVTDAMGCIANGSIVITEPNLLVVTEDTHGDVSCNTGNDGFSSVLVVGGTGPYNYLWDLNGTPVSTSQSANSLTAGSYLVTVTDANGCSDNITIVITEPNALTANATPTDADCFGANTGSAFVSVVGGTTPYAYQWTDAALQQTDTVTSLIAGSYDVTVTDSLGCNFVIAGVVINEPTQLVLNTTTVSSTCGNNNGNATVAVGGGTPSYSFAWNDPATQSTITADSLLAGNYVITVTDGNGCIDSTTANVIDLGSPTITITSTTDVSCAGAGDGAATSATVGGTTPYTYSWNTTPVQTTANAINLDGQTYSVTVTDSNGCTASASAIIIENSGLSAAITGSTNVSCNGLADGDATVLGAGGGAPYTYSWNSVPTQTTTTASGLTAGTYIVTISDTNLCTAKDTVTITEPAPLTVTLDSLSDVLCNAGNDGFISVVGAGGTLGYAYAWTPNVSSGATAAGLVAGNYAITITDANGCTVSDNYDVFEPNQLVIDTVTTPSTCGAPNGTATVSIVTGSTPNYTYAWNDPSNQTTATASNLNASTYTVTVTDANGCSVTMSPTVLNQAGPIIDSLTVTAVSCNGGSDGTATVYVSGNAPFQYSWDDPFTQTNQTATGLSASPPLYTVTVTDVNNCISSSAAQISEPAPLNAFINSPDTICSGESIQLFGNANGGTPPYNYAWGGGQNGQGPITETPTTSTVYSLNVLDGSPAGCQANVTKTVVVRAALSVSATDVTICQGDVATLNAASTGGNLNNGIQYFWMEIDSTSGALSPTGVANPVNPIQLSPSATTDYIVWVEDGCSTADTTGVTININDTATAQLVPVIDTCLGISQNFALTTDIGVTFDWDFDSDGTIDVSTASTTTSHTYTSSGTYDVTVTLTTAQGCTSSVVGIGLASVAPNPVADFTTDPNPPIVTLLNPVFDFIDQSVGASTWNWNLGDATFDTVQNPTHEYADTGSYNVTLYVTSAFGCSDQITKTVVVKPDFFFAIPNTFTPNGNGLNEVFMPGSLVGATNKNYGFYIFDRWGELIFEGHDLTDGWNGTANGGSLISQIGTYVWIVEVTDLEGNPHRYTGHVNLLK